MDAAGVDLRHPQLRPSGGLPALDQKLRHGVQHHQIGAVRPHQNIPQLLPDDAHAHEAPQKVPVGQLFLPPEGCPQAPDRTVAPGVLRLHPVRQKQEQSPLRAVVAAPADIGRLRDPRRVEQVHGLGLLGGAQKIRGRRNIPVRRLPGPVQHLCQQHPVVPQSAALIQQSAFIHAAAPVSAPAPHRRRFSPSIPGGCPAPPPGPPQ